MPITNVRVTRPMIDDGHTVALASARLDTLEGWINLTDIALVKGNKEYFLSFPGRSKDVEFDGEDGYKNFFMLSENLWRELQDQIVAEYEENFVSK